MSNDCVGVLAGGRLASKISSGDLSFGESGEDGILNSDSFLVQSHVSQHHDGREKERSWVGKSCDVSDQCFKVKKEIYPFLRYLEQIREQPQRYWHRFRCFPMGSIQDRR